MKNYNYSIIPTVVSLDEVFERADQGLIEKDWEYKNGFYNELNVDLISKRMDIFRVIKNNLPPQEKRVIEKTLKNEPLSIAERKAKERGIKRMRKLLTT